MSYRFSIYYHKVSAFPYDKIKTMEILLRKIRMEKGLTLRQVETLTNVPRSTLSRIERGEVSPTLSDLEMLARGLHIRIADLFSSQYK